MPLPVRSKPLSSYMIGVQAYAMSLFLGAILGLPGNTIIIMEFAIAVSFSYIDRCAAVGFASLHSVPKRRI